MRAMAILAMLLVLLQQQTFFTYSTAPTPKHTPTPPPNPSIYLYYPCKGYPRQNAVCCGTQGFTPAGGLSSNHVGTSCAMWRPRPRPSGQARLAPVTQKAPVPAPRKSPP